jgi:CMP-N-acetylneuraminic acid synthetase/regulator of RNase E activity RraA
MVKVVAFLPVKGTSERIKNKNIQLLDGKPLFLYTLEKLISCDFIDEIYLDSESTKIFELASELNFKKIKRDKRLANNKTDGNKLFMNEVSKVKGDIYIQILCTSPFIETETIKKGVDLLKKTNKYDSVVLVKKDKQYCWKDGKTVYNIGKIPNSKDLPDTIIETMGLYIIKENAALKTKRRIGKNPFLLEVSPLEAVDVNYPADFRLAELIQKGKKVEENFFYKNIKNHLSSAMLSDILDELGIKGVIKNLKPNFPSKIFGRAKTLKLRKKKYKEDYKKIYEALKSYETLSDNDVIVVENELPDFAYFGEMNANLAIRAGSSGVIINGKTRDTLEVLKLNLPVFSKGSTCADVKKRAVLDSINKKITIEGIDIFPEDLIFGDSEGIIVIPKKNKDQILKKAFEIISKEKTILQDIALNLDITKIINKNGYF